MLRIRPAHCLALAAGFALFVLGATAHAQSDPVEVTNDETQPIPVYTAGRAPYQFLFNLHVLEDSKCVDIPAPTGATLTIEAVSARLDIADGTDLPFYLQIDEGIGTFLSRGPLDRYGRGDSRTRYSTLFHPKVHVGPMDSGGRRTARVCLHAASGRSSVNFASGIVSGHVEPVAMVDGNAIGGGPDPCCDTTTDPGEGTTGTLSPQTSTPGPSGATPYGAGEGDGISFDFDVWRPRP